MTPNLLDSGQIEDTDAVLLAQYRTEINGQVDNAEVFAQKLSQIPFWLLLLYGATNLGTGTAWSIQFALATPFFEETLGSGHIISHIVWILGPISGLVVAPLIGIWSDRCRSRWGRRRPFIVIGTLAGAVGMILFSHAPQLSSLFGFLDEYVQHLVTISIAVISLAIIDFSINIYHWPSRALLGDIIPPEQQHAVQGSLIIGTSLSDLVMNAIIHQFSEPVAHIRLLYILAVTVFTSSALLLLWLTRAADPRSIQIHPQSATGNDYDDETRTSLSSNPISRMKSLPEWVWRVGLTTSLGWLMLFCVRPNASAWLGRSVLGGDPDASPGSSSVLKYEHGVKMYSQASILRALLQIVIGIAYPQLVNAGFKPSHQVGFAYFLSSVIVACFARTKNAAYAQGVIAILAFPMAFTFATTNAVPVALSTDSDRGTNLGIINTFAVIAQMADTVYTGSISRAWGESAVMLIGAGWGFAAFVAAFIYAW